MDPFFSKDVAITLVVRDLIMNVLLLCFYYEKFWIIITTHKHTHYFFFDFENFLLQNGISKYLIFKSLLNYLPFLPSCLTCLCSVRAFSPLRVFVPYVPSWLTCITCLDLYEPDLYALHALFADAPYYSHSFKCDKISLKSNFKMFKKEIKTKGAVFGI